MSSSSSGDVAACALSLSGPMGIDIERSGDESTQRMQGALSVAFSSEELSDSEFPIRREPVLAWTVKEAASKALGVGLTRDPRSLRIGGTLGATTIADVTGEHCLDTWSVRTYRGSNYVWAVASGSKDQKAVQFTLGAPLSESA